MGIGRAGHLEIKLAVKLATQQISKVMRQPFQLFFSSPKQAPELFTQRQQSRRHHPLRQILLIDLIYATQNESFKGIDKPGISRLFAFTVYLFKFLSIHTTDKMRQRSQATTNRPAPVWCFIRFCQFGNRQTLAIAVRRQIHDPRRHIGLLKTTDCRARGIPCEKRCQTF